MPFRSRFTVRFGDIDPAGVVYYPRFLHYCHMAMEEFFAGQVGLPYPRLIAEHGVGFPAVHLEVDFRRPLRYGDDVEIQVSIARIGNTSVEWLYELHRGGDSALAAEAKVVTACLDFERFRACGLPDWLREAFQRSMATGD